MVGQREVDEQEYAKWNKKYVNALCALVNREKQIEQVAEEIEYGFELVGSTAIEDKL